MVGPILQLKDELFQTFRQRRSIVSVQEYETDKASLERMLKDFESDFATSAQVLHQDSCLPCMDTLLSMLKDFESDFAKAGQVLHRGSCKPCTHMLLIRKNAGVTCLGVMQAALSRGMRLLPLLWLQHDRPIRHMFWLESALGRWCPLGNPQRVT